MDIKEIAARLWKEGNFKDHSKLARYLYEKYGKLHYANFGSMRRSISTVCKRIDEDRIERNLDDFIKEGGDIDDIIALNVKLKRRIQFLEDNRRVEKKHKREGDRGYNTIKTYLESLNEQLGHLGGKIKVNLKRIDKEGGGIGIIQVTDVHANEYIDTINNQYNIDVLSRRAKKLVDESLKYFKFRGVSKVLMAFTGDLLNSDRRQDEKVNQITNRSKSSVLMAHFVAQMICDVAQYYPVDVISVLGNESRVNQEMTFSNEAFSDNYDFIIMAMARMIITSSNIPDIKFLSIDKMETVVDLGEQRWLFAHDVSKYTSNQSKVQQTVGRFSLSGDNIDFIVSGHIHSFQGTDISCRSGSMVGSNEYNEHGLNLYSRASGVCYVAEGKSRFYQYIDLQEADNEGYEYESKLEAYNIKSSGKVRPQKTILEIVV